MHRPKLSGKRIKILMCVSVIVASVVIALFYGFWIDFQTFYSGVMKNLNSSKTKAYMRDKINGTYNFVELLSWTDQNLNWSDACMHEVKKTSASLKEEQIGKQLIVDVAKYQEYKGVNTLICFIYDPEQWIENPKGLENDLQKLSTKKLKVEVFVCPRNG